MTSLTLAWFLAPSTLIVLIGLLWGARRTQVDQRVADLSKAGTAGTTTSLDAAMPALGGSDSRVNRWTTRRIRREQRKNTLKEKMTQAGFYRPRTVRVFFVFRLFLMLIPTVLGVVAARLGHVSLLQGILFGSLAGLAGTLTPSLWLNHVKNTRQMKIRQSLPDALDVMVICLEGGLSLSGSFSRVAKELATAHPMLAVEFNIIERQIQMGRTTGEAVRGLADRFDLEELRSMASVIVQAERVGSSVSTALRIFADTLRQKRHQRAEELAHKASVKLLFPTIFFIFPGIFIVVLGPAAINIYQGLIHGAFSQ